MTAAEVGPLELLVVQPTPFCNLDCTYCFFLSKEAPYPNDKSRMSGATLETYIRQLLESHLAPQVTVAWQGGEPTLMKLDFFQRSIKGWTVTALPTRALFVSVISGTSFSKSAIMPQ